MSSLENALRVMTCFGRDRRTVRVAELARELSLPKSSMSRLLRALADFRMLERSDGDLAYQIGPRVAELAELRSTRHPLTDTADMAVSSRSEERRVGKECRSRWSPYH